MPNSSKLMIGVAITEISNIDESNSQIDNEIKQSIN